MARRPALAATCLALLLAGPSGATPDAPAPAGPTDGDSFTFAVVGHVRGNRNGELVANLDEVVDELQRLGPDLVFLAGDLIWGDVHGEGASDPDVIRRDWEQLDAAFARLGVPVYRVPGNHDINDVTTRDVWLERYGPIPRSLRYGNSLFLLLRSGFWPEDDDPRKNPKRYVRGQPLDEAQIAFVSDRLREDAAGDPAHAEAGPPEHVFLVMHHMLWWRDQARWWRDVHPLLTNAPVRAVFAGDYGPMKFSHLRRDGIDYVQTSIDGQVSVELLRALELSRVLSAQLDNFLLVHVDGPEVRIEVRTVGALTTGKFTPQLWREVHGDPQQRQERADRARRHQLITRGLLVALGAVLGAGVTLVWRRLAARP